MGLFSSSSKSTSTSNLNQTDSKQTTGNDAVQAHTASAAISSAGGKINSFYSYGSGNQQSFTIYDLDAELAQYAIESNVEVVKKTLTDGLGFANDQIDRVLKLARDNLTQSGNQLEETRAFSASLLDKVSETSDERLKKLSYTGMILIAGLAGLLAWRTL